MQQFLLDLVGHYGYVIIVLGVGIESMGVPVPGETALLIGAVFAARGHLCPLGVGLCGWFGAVVGDNLGYSIGRRWGQGFMTRPGVRRLYSPERVVAADRFFERFGWLAVFLGRFAALLRIFAGPLAGMHRMPWPRFLLANALGASLWTTAVVAVGLLIGDNLDRAASILTKGGYVGLALFVAAGALAITWRYRRKHAGGA